MCTVDTGHLVGIKKMSGMFVHRVAERPSLGTTVTSEGPVIVRLLLAMKNL